MAIPDFSAYEKTIIQQTVDERWGKGKVSVEEVEVELRLYKDDRNVTLCPAIYWQHEDCNFIIAKVFERPSTDERRYRSQFFYSAKDQYGTGIEEYTDLGDCVLYLLRLQADHESERKQNFPTS